MTIITNEGKKLITHSIINKLDLFISKVVYADCNLDTLDENTTALTNIKYENLPTSVRIDEFDNSKIILEAVLKNDTARDFFINCVGFIAKNGELLCFTKINRTPVLSKATDTNASLFHYKLAIELKNAKDLSIKIDETIVYPTLSHFNASQKAQDEKIDKLGLDKVNTSDFTASQKAQDEKIKTLETNKADKLNVFTRDEINTKLSAKANNTDLTKVKNDLETRIKAVEDDRMKVYTTPLTCSVGVGGEFKTLAEAFKALSYFKKASPSVGNCVITMLPNFVLKEFLYFENCDLSHITLTSSNNCIISCDFANPISENRNVFSFHNANSCFFYKAHFNFINQPQGLIIAGNNANIRFAECSVKNATYGLLAYDSNLNVKSSTFTNIKKACLYATEKSSVNSIVNTFDTSSRGIYSMRNTTTNSYRDIFKNITNECFYVDWGGFAMYEAHPNGSFVNSPKKCNLVPNTLYKHGIFFDRTTNEGALIQKDVPYGKLFELNGLKILILRNVPIVPVVGADRYQNHLNMGHYEVFYSFTLPISGFFLVGASYKGAFCSGQTLNNFHRIYRNRDAQRDMHTVPAVGQPFEREKLNFNFIAIGL
ncbi:hypothetical protein AVANS_0713 [Campylobacter sp. RM5004]|uniref:phage tail-collar fiber domain-containing protein n=1 Tax=Campylobacter sp. RM5004 TaxID=1660078 RepID=UPI001EFB0D90|nr:phage tail protein [Campylobacter sp. RM5004]ULO01343.1 hypothetical protein AVANS_0713 [Campylobacter sp. RM5004]